MFENLIPKSTAGPSSFPKNVEIDALKQLKLNYFYISLFKMLSKIYIFTHLLRYFTDIQF